MVTAANCYVLGVQVPELHTVFMSSARCIVRSAAVVWLFTLLANAQDATALMNEPTIKAAFQAVQQNEPHMLDEQARVCEIPAPPFHEEQRGLEFKRLFESLQLKDVHIDKAGNVIGTRPGQNPKPNVVLAGAS
jgi:tripeptide aminopeptidase